MQNRRLIFRSLGLSGTAAALIVLAEIVNIQAQTPAPAPPASAVVEGSAFLTQYLCHLPQSKAENRGTASRHHRPAGCPAEWRTAGEDRPQGA
jgi:hypothetical protein